MTPLAAVGIIPARQPPWWFVEEVRALDDKLKTMLDSFSRALSAAMADSSDVGQSLRSIQDAGYSLCLRVDCRRHSERDPEGADAPAASGEPTFKINGHDLAMLRSLGIDPTRRIRRRRRGAPLVL